jgi:hypothetical protein
MNKKFLVALRKREDARTVRESGCDLLAEYPNSLLVSCSEPQRDKLQRAGLEINELERPPISISGASFTLDDALNADRAAPITPDPNRTAYYLVQIIGPVKGDWLTHIRTLGGRVHGTLQRYTLLVGILPGRLSEIRKEPWVEAVTPYRPSMKVSRRLRPGVGRALGVAELTAVKTEGEAPDAQEQVEINVFPGESTASLEARIREAGGLIVAKTQTSVTAAVPRQVLPQLAEIQGVQAIVPHQFPEFTNDVAAGIMDAPANRVFGDLTLRGTGQIVAVADSGLDTGDAAAIHDDFAGRIVAIVSQPNTMGIYTNDPPPYDDGPSDTNSGHGTHVAGSVLANGAAAAAAGSLLIPQGLAPGARIYFQAIEQEANWKTWNQLIADGHVAPGTPQPDWWPPRDVGLYGLPDDLTGIFDAAYTAGARIHTNSWNAPDAGLYNERSQQVDRFMWNHRDMLIIFSASNDGIDRDGVAGNGVIDEDSIGTPATAKNCLTVGASENDRPSGASPPPGYDINWTDWRVRDATGALIQRWPRLGDAGHVSDNPDGMAAFSSRGPTDDGRRKPDLVAPGTNVLSVRSSLVGADPLWGDLPVGHDLRGLYCWSGGTSMSTPLVAGAAALVRQHLVQQRGHFQDGVKPSGALIKAFLINGAESIAPGQFEADTTGTPPIPATDEIPDEPNNVDGFGRANVTRSLVPGRLGLALFADEPDYAVESGQIRTFAVQAVDTAEPLKVTLVWTDRQGPADIGGLENELYLRVREPGGGIVDGDSTPYPTVTNNVQQVVIDAPGVGTYEIEVHGVTITHQAPGAGGGANPRQDFALVVSNAMGFSLQPVSIAQAIDTTGSMGTFGYMEPAKERAGQLLDFMRSNDRVSITEFSQRGGVPDARTPFETRLLGSFDPDWEDAHAAIDGLHDNGRTPIGAGLLEAYIQLTAAPEAHPRAIVLLSDGQNNEPPNPDVVLPAIPASIPIFAIALGPACSEATLRDIADSRPNGGYYSVESDEDIFKLHEIYAQIQALTAGDALVGLSSAHSESSSESKHPMPIEKGVKEATFTLSWNSGAGVEKMELFAWGPDGKRYDAAMPATIERNGERHCLVRIAVPRPGKWDLMVKNHGSARPVAYTVSGSVQSILALTAEAPKVRPKQLLVIARLHMGDKPWDAAEVTARVTMPTLSRRDILKEFGDRIKEMQLSERVIEKGLSEEQVLNLKIAVFAQKFREKDGGLYRRKTTQVVMTPKGNGTWIAEFPTSAPGNADIEIVAKGKIGDFQWTRQAVQSAYMPEPAVTRRKLDIEDIVVRRNRLWPYAIIGARVLKQDGSPATPADGTVVGMKVSQGRHQATLKRVEYYARGAYYIWRFREPGFKTGEATVAVTASLDGITAKKTETVTL